MSTIPYPRRNESWASWDSRCREAEADNQRWRREQAARNANWGGYNYRPVKRGVAYTLPGGQVVQAVKLNSSYSRGERIRRFAIANQLCFTRVTTGRGMTARTDNIAFQPTSEILDRYNNDDH